jgi:ATP-dependent DNA ligase
VLGLDGTNTMREPYWRRREILESLNLAGPHWTVTPSFADGDALERVVEAQSLEGLVAKAARQCLQARGRGWLDVKNRAYWKYAIEREAVFERSLTRALP